MVLSKVINSELDSLKSRILYLERIIENAQCSLEFANDNTSKAEVKSHNKSIELCLAEIEQIVTTQAKSMNLEHTVVLDLIFDREHTLSLI